MCYGNRKRNKVKSLESTTSGGGSATSRMHSSASTAVCQPCPNSVANAPSTTRPLFLRCHGRKRCGQKTLLLRRPDRSGKAQRQNDNSQGQPGKTHIADACAKGNAGFIGWLGIPETSTRNKPLHAECVICGSYWWSRHRPCETWLPGLASQWPIATAGPLGVGSGPCSGRGLARKTERLFMVGARAHARMRRIDWLIQHNHVFGVRVGACEACFLPFCRCSCALAETLGLELGVARHG